MFWALFIGFQYVAALGIGSICFQMDKDHAKKILVLLAASYVLNSAYYVTIDNKGLNKFLKYVIAAFNVYYLVSLAVQSRVNMRTLNDNE